MVHERYDPYARDDLLTVAETVRDILEEIRDEVLPLGKKLADDYSGALEYDSKVIKNICCDTLPVTAERDPDDEIWGLEAQSGDARALTWLVDRPYAEFYYRGEKVGEYHMLEPHSIVDVINQYCHRRAMRYASLDGFSPG